jgi:hypothetical protein
MPTTIRRFVGKKRVGGGGAFLQVAIAGTFSLERENQFAAFRRSIRCGEPCFPQGIGLLFSLGRDASELWDESIADPGLFRTEETIASTDRGNREIRRADVPRPPEVFARKPIGCSPHSYPVSQVRIDWTVGTDPRLRLPPHGCYCGTPPVGRTRKAKESVSVVSGERGGSVFGTRLRTGR